MTQQSEQRIAHFTFLPGIPHQRRNSPKTLISTMSLLSIRRCLRDAVQCDDAAEKEKRLIRRYKAFAFCCRKRNFVVNAISDQTLCSATLRRLLIIKIVNKFIISRRRGQCCTHYHQQISSVAAWWRLEAHFCESRSQACDLETWIKFQWVLPPKTVGKIKEIPRN